MKNRATTLVLLLILVGPLPGFGQGAPETLSFQGFLTDDLGDPINDPSVQMTFKIYDGNTQIWSETHPTVAVTNGIFNVLLGGTTALEAIPFNRPLSRGITVASDAEMVPRTPLAAAPYAKAMPGLYTFYDGIGLNRGYNVVGGSPENVVGSSAGATISGGGGVLMGLSGTQRGKRQLRNSWRRHREQGRLARHGSRRAE